MIQPADFAVAVTQQVEVTTKDGVNGRVIGSVGGRSRKLRETRNFSRRGRCTW